jgi:uncharacterized protein YecE (DUF72 family)
MSSIGKSTVLIGTASWTDKTLIASGRFYPKTVTTAEARLRHYASQFPLVEVDSSYYAMPAAATAQLWAERTPAGFTFNVKSFRLFTGHQTQPKVLPKDIQQQIAGSALGSKRTLYERDLPGELRDELWRRFIEALVPLRQAGKLGLVHFQFAPWVLRNHDGHALVRDRVERMQGHVVGVEFHNETWFRSERATASTLAFERELEVVQTVVDGPQGFANSVPAVWEATHPRVALVRLHGRNTATYNVKAASASDRFNYDYSDKELRGLVTPVCRLGAEVPTTHVVFNNNWEDQGQRNAATLKSLLKLPAGFGSTANRN